ncbi:hypothetical protein CHS0354_025381 [Potamilus streckersoni]|uniref:Cytochrome P450 n=1 Tax=Potamilus streckersoni TaxID=2493646 RepID=A0AAE0SPP7_9BIVA|nr:hypothetical protein CHS0354_025381 [Potamilus streckersoni]
MILTTASLGAQHKEVMSCDDAFISSDIANSQMDPSHIIYWSLDFLYNDMIFEPGKWMVTLTVLFLTVIFFWKCFRKSFPPGPIAKPIFGNLDLLRNKPHIALTNLTNGYGDVYSLKLGWRKAVVVCSYEGIKEGLVDLETVCNFRPNLLSAKLLFCGNQERGLLFAACEEKLKLKKDFTRHVLYAFCSHGELLHDTLTDETFNLVCSLVNHEGPVCVHNHFESLALRIQLLLVVGKLYDPEDTNFVEIMQTYKLRSAHLKLNLYDYLPKLFTHFGKLEESILSEQTHMQLDFFRQILNRHKDCYNPKIINDMMDHMLVVMENNEDMGLLDQEDLDYLFLEICGSGFRAISSLILWLLAYMTTFQDVQTKVQQELDTVVGSERLPVATDQPFLPYTCAVIMETHRLASVIPLTFPHRTEKCCKFQGYDIPKDTIMLFNIWNLHHDSQYWINPMKFDPTRFLREDGSLHIPDHFLPFGAGPRACPGESLVELEVFIIFTNILHQLELHPLDGNPPCLEGEYVGHVLQPRPFYFNVTPRFKNETY